MSGDAELLFKLAHMVAREWERKQHVFEYDELVSVCWLGGNAAIPRHDPSLGALTTYLVPRMRGAVLDALRGALGRYGKHANLLSAQDTDFDLMYGAVYPQTVSHEDEVLLDYELTRLRARLRPVDQRLFDAVLSHGFGGTEERLYASVASELTLKTFRIHRGQVIRQLKALLQAAA